MCALFHNKFMIDLTIHFKPKPKNTMLVLMFMNFFWENFNFVYVLS